MKAFNSYLNLLYISIISAVISGCTADKPAPTERKEKLYYGQSGVVQLVKISRSQSINELAHIYGVDAELLAKLNHKAKKATIYPGEVIKIPVSSDISFEEELFSNDASQESYEEIESTQLDIDEEVVQKHETWVLGDDELEQDINSQMNNPKVNDDIITKKQIDQNAFKYSTPLNSEQFIWPVNGKVISRYGKSGQSFNEGISIEAPLGTVVRAAADGEIVHAGHEPKVYGNLVIIKHTGNYLTAYAHNDKISVKKGTKVKQGQAIATVGKTGIVTTPQLNFLIRKNKKTIDPESFFID